MSRARPRRRRRLGKDRYGNRRRTVTQRKHDQHRLQPLFSPFSLHVIQTPTHLSACVLRKNQPGADGHDRRRDLFSNPMLKRNHILAKSKLNKEL